MPITAYLTGYFLCRFFKLGVQLYNFVTILLLNEVSWIAVRPVACHFTAFDRF